MRPIRTAILTILAAMTTLPLGSAARAEDEEGEEEAYTVEPVVYAQRRLVMAKGLLRPDLALLIGDTGADIFVGFGVAVDWTPIDKLQVGALGAPRLSPEADEGAPTLYVRYLLLETPLGLAVQGGYTFTDPGPGSLHLAVPLSIPLNPAARLNFTPTFFINLPESGGEVSFDLDLPFSLGVSLTRAIYLDLRTGLNIPDFDFDLASLPLSLELGYSIKGAEETAFVDIFLRFGFDHFLLPNAPEGADTLNLDQWTLAIGARAHVGLE